MIGRKIYYELATGDVVLITEEKQGLNAANTTKEQDFAMYSPLQVRDPETIDFIQLEYGQYAADIQVARAVHMDPETRELQFEYPEYVPPLTTQLENQSLIAENTALRERVEQQETAMLEMTMVAAQQEQRADLTEQAIIELSMVIGGGDA